MPNPAFFEEAFHRVAVNGAIGDPNGLTAFGYLRVSSDGQAEEGRSGLPRQIQHAHEAGMRDGYRIPWEMIYADDESGFTLDRPALKEMIDAMNRPGRPADAVVIEHLDRLSRDADWHQGYLLHLFQKKLGVRVIFWKQINSRIERMVLGAISQDGMERAKEIMAAGRLDKARSGRVTAGPNVAFGYQKVDRHGNPNGDVSRDTHYGIVADQAAVVRFIFESLAYRGMTLYQIIEHLNGRYAPPRKMRAWDRHYLWEMVKNPVYKGKFAAFRWKCEITEIADPVTGELIKIRRNIERPESEWELVDVPPIVSEEVWEAANKAMEKNRLNARRNQKHSYLLTGLLRCVCGRTMVGHGVRSGKASRAAEVPNLFYYRCTSNLGWKHTRTICTAQSNRAPRADVLERAVWMIVREILNNPARLLSHLDETYASDQNQAIASQIEYLKWQITEHERDDEKEHAVYKAGGYTAEEYAEIHKDHKQRIANLKEDIADLERKFVTLEKVEAQKQYILEMTAEARAYGLDENARAEVRRALIKIAVDEITVDMDREEFTIVGEINGTWPMALGRMAGEDGSGEGEEGGVIGLESARHPPSSAGGR